MSSKTSTSSTKSTGRKTSARKSTKTAAKKTTASKRSTAAVAPVPTSSPVAFATLNDRVLAIGSSSRRFDDYREAAQIATKRFQTTASRPGADPTKQSGVTTANVADAAAALKSRKLTAAKLVGIPVADVIRYAETGELTKKAQTGELVRKLREFSNDTFGNTTRNKLRGKRMAALVSVLMEGGLKSAGAKTAAVAARSFATKSTTKSASKKSGRKSTKSTGRKSARKSA